MIDSTFYGVCVDRHPPVDRYRRRNLHRASDRRRSYRRRIPRPHIILRRCRRRAKTVRQHLYRLLLIFYICRRACVNRKGRVHPHRVHPATNLVNRRRQARPTSVTFAVPTVIRGSKFARRYEPLMANECVYVCLLHFG